MLVGPKNVFGPDPNPKNSHKKVQKSPKWGRMKTKDSFVIPKPKLIVYIDRFPDLFAPSWDQFWVHAYSKTYFRINLDPKLTAWEQKEVLKPLN